MFKIFQEIFNRKNLLQEALEESWTMLQIDQQMFDASVKSLRRHDSAEVELDLYNTDQEINRLEQDVRKKVITHLAVSSATDLSVGLTLVSIISDIERIGDYTKNIYELARVHPKKLTAGKWEDDLALMEKRVSEGLAGLLTALKESDAEMGRKILEELSQVKAKCDSYILSLLEGEEQAFKTNEAVSLALYLRYLKRVASHIQNVASSLVNPFHRIKYMDKHTKLVDEGGSQAHDPKDK